MSNKFSEFSDVDLVKKISSGESDAFIELASRYVPSIRYRAGSFKNLETEDLCQEGLLSLLRAAFTFDEKKDIKFHTYADACIYNRFLSLSRKNGTQRAIPRDSIVSFDDEIGKSCDDIVLDTDPERLLIEREEIRRIKDELKTSLSELELKVFYLYLNGYKYSEISEKLSVSQKSVDNSVQRIRKKMKKFF